MKYYKMKESYSLQRWYDPTGIFSLVEKHEDRSILHFGKDCTWRNEINGNLYNNWDTVMREISKEEKREFLISRLLI